MEQDKKDEIVKLYQSGVNRYNIHLQTGSSKKTVNTVLLNSGIDFQKKEKEDYRSRLDQIIPLYKSGVSQVDLEKKLSLTRKTIREILKNSDVEYRSGGEAISLANGNLINHKAFNNLEDEEVLYWIGLIYTDGHVNIGGKDNSVEIALHYQDKELLEKFKTFLNCNNTISKLKDQNCWKFRFFSERIKNVLQNLGFTSNKTAFLIPDNRLKHSRHFWRGCIDGDGSIYIYKQGKYQTTSISICGTYDTCLGFIEFVEENGIQTKKVPSKANGKNLYVVQFSWKQALKIEYLLYSEAKIFMERKQKLFVNHQRFIDDYKALHKEYFQYVDYITEHEKEGIKIKFEEIYQQLI